MNSIIKRVIKSYLEEKDIRTVELIHDTEQLGDWKKIEGRVRIRNAINKRLEAIRTGKT